MPSFNPILNNKAGDKADMAKSLKLFMRGHQLGIDSCLPAIVLAYDRVNNVATVKPLIMNVMVDDTIRSRKPIAQVPVLALGGGGFFINFPLAEGDLGWILATDRDISLFKQTLSEQSPPNGGSLHSFENSMFVPDVFRKYTVNGADSAAMVISSTDGNTRISIKNGEIDIIAPTQVVVTTPLAKFSKDVQIAGNLTVTGNATITGQTAVNGGFTAAGSGGSGSFVTLPANTTINGIVVATHGHISSSAGSRTSGNMIT